MELKKRSNVDTKTERTIISPSLGSIVSIQWYLLDHDDELSSLQFAIARPVFTSFGQLLLSFNIFRLIHHCRHAESHTQPGDRPNLHVREENSWVLSIKLSDLG